MQVVCSRRMHIWAHATIPPQLQPQQPSSRRLLLARSAVSLEHVLRIANRVAGGTVDADAPLMDAGLDSLGAVELRNQLQQTVGSGTTLPNTLVFDHPTTSRQIAAAFAPQAEPAVGIQSKRQGASTTVSLVESVSVCQAAHVGMANGVQQLTATGSRPARSLSPGADGALG